MKPCTIPKIAHESKFHISRGFPHTYLHFIWCHHRTSRYPNAPVTPLPTKISKSRRGSLNRRHKRERLTWTAAGPFGRPRPRTNEHPSAAVKGQGKTAIAIGADSKPRHCLSTKPIAENLSLARLQADRTATGPGSDRRGRQRRWALFRRDRRCQWKIQRGFRTIEMLSC